MDLTLTEEEAAHWVYRGEGAVNLVLAYTGSSPSYIGKVIRIRKVPNNGSKSQCVKNTIALTPHERLIWKNVHELVSSSDNEIADQLFAQHVMKPLLGPKYVDAGMHVLMTKEFLELVEKNVNSLRPAWRVDAARVDTHCNFGVLMSDHSLFTHGIETGSQGSSPCISVEIKPKCGFLPLSRFISEGNAIKKRITRFEMHQALKLHQGEISQPSVYNPLDLFSGPRGRIYKAITDLFITPQNNFRVFLNGSLILGGLGGGTKNTDAYIAKVFEDELKSVIRANDGLCMQTLFILVTEALKKSGVLDQLLQVQKLDDVDIEGAIHAYYNITSQECMVCRELSEEQAKRYTSLHSASLDESFRIVKDYLIAATAKDCSLMICFRPRKEEESGSVYNHVYVESTQQFFDFKVYFIDLDLKRLLKMEEHYELDKKIVSCYKQMFRIDHGRNEPKWNGELMPSHSMIQKHSTAGTYISSSNSNTPIYCSKYEATQSPAWPMRQKAAKRKAKIKVANASGNNVDMLAREAAVREKNDMIAKETLKQREKNDMIAKDTLKLKHVNFVKFTEILMKDTSEMSEEKKANHMLMCDYIRRQL